MDEHRPQTSDKAVNANGGTPVGAAAVSNSDKVKTHPPAGSVAEEVATKTKQVADELIEHAKNVAGAALTSMPEELGEQVQDAARRIGDRTAATTKAAGDYLTRSAGASPLTALLVAGAVGYALAYLVHRH